MNTEFLERLKRLIEEEESKVQKKRNFWKSATTNKNRNLLILNIPELLEFDKNTKSVIIGEGGSFCTYNKYVDDKDIEKFCDIKPKVDWSLSTTKIKSCPFCGSDGRVRRYNGYRYKVDCVKECCFLTTGDLTEQEAIDR